MTDIVAVGAEITERHEIDKDRTIGFMGEDCRVYSTPSLLYDMEIACRNLLLKHIEAGQDSVGTYAELSHNGPTLLGMWVEINAKVVEVKGPAVKFEVTARDALEQVATCKHARFVVGVESTKKRLRGKLEKFRAL
jgi:predicted thioesterase